VAADVASGAEAARPESSGTGHGSDEPSPPLPPGADEVTRKPRPWLFCLAAYAVSRLFVAVGALAAVIWPARGVLPVSLSQFAKRRDGWWYLYIARHGYPRTLHPLALSHVRWSPWAFFPGYPVLLRGAHLLLPIRYGLLAVGVSAVLGLTAVRSVYHLGQTVSGAETARWSAALFAAWPGSAVLSMAYSEGLFITAAAVALAALVRRTWWLAGLAGLVAAVARPAGVAILAAAIVAAATDLRRTRSPRALLAPALTVAGPLAFALYGRARTGDILVWRHAENLWHQRLDLGVGFFTSWGTALVTGGRKLVRSATTAMGLTAVVAAATITLRSRRRLDLVLVAYTAVALAQMLGYSLVFTKPRFVLALLPLFVWVAMAGARRRLAVACAVCLVLLGVFSYAYLTVLTP
jgi:hypothetical protein